MAGAMRPAPQSKVSNSIRGSRTRLCPRTELMERWFAGVPPPRPRNMICSSDLFDLGTRPCHAGISISIAGFRKPVKGQKDFLKFFFRSRCFWESLT